MPHRFPLMLFAAGLGTRMGALTATRPKPLIPVAGRALIDHALAVADAAPLSRIVVNLHYRAAQMRAHLALRPGLFFSDETGGLLETGGGLRQALPLLGEGPVMALNADAVWTGPNPLAALAEAWQPERMDGLLLLLPKDRATGHSGAGDFDRDAEGRLSRGRAMVYAGAQILTTGDLGQVTEPAFSLNRVWDLMAARKRLFGLVHQGGWCDVGRPEALPLAEALLAGALPPGATDV